MRGGAVGVAALATATLASLTTTEAASAGPSRVLLVRDRGADAVIDRAEVRLAAELRAAGFEVEERVVEGDDDARKLIEEPGDTGPFATVLLRRTGARAATDVWVADHVTHKTVVRRIGSRGAGEGADRALALRVVELMRASLVEGLVLPPVEDEPSSPEPLSPAPAPPDVAAWTREAIHPPMPTTSRVVLGVGVAAAFAGPDVGMAVAPEVRVAWRASDMWSLGLIAAGPGFGGRVVGVEGSATVRQELALIEVAFEPPTGGPVRAFLAAGAGAYHLYASGDATSGFVGHGDDAWAALGAAGGGVRVRLAGAASVVLDVRELLALPRPVLVFGAERVAASMHPGTLGGLSLAVDL
jgi:hypothetical protein